MGPSAACNPHEDWAKDTPCRKRPTTPLKALEVAGSRGRRAVTARLALSSGLQPSGVPMDTLLAQHCRDAGVRIMHMRAEEAKRRAEELAAQKSLKRPPPDAFKRIRQAVQLKQQKSDTQMIREVLGSWHAADSLNLVNGAGKRAQNLEEQARRARRQLPPLLSDVFAVRSYAPSWLVMHACKADACLQSGCLTVTNCWICRLCTLRD